MPKIEPDGSATADDARQCSASGHQREDVEVRIKINQQRQCAILAHELGQGQAYPSRDDQSCAGAEDHHDERLCQRLPDEAPTACTQGDAHGEVQFATQSVSKHHVRKVQAGDDEKKYS
jgi:hypothetical protein